jgi:hypothetical protein
MFAPDLKANKKDLLLLQNAKPIPANTEIFLEEEKS